MHPHWTSVFEFWLQGDFGLTLPFTATTGAEGAWVFATLTKYLATNFESPKSRDTRLPALIYWVWFRVFCPFFSFVAHCTPLHPPFLNFGPVGFAHGRTKRHLLLPPSCQVCSQSMNTVGGTAYTASAHMYTILCVYAMLYYTYTAYKMCML